MITAEYIKQSQITDREERAGWLQQWFGKGGKKGSLLCKLLLYLQPRRGQLAIIPLLHLSPGYFHIYIKFHPLGMTLVLICQWSRILQRKETPRTDSSPSSANESLLSGSNNTNQRLHYLSSIISKNWLQLSPSWNYWHFNVGKVEGGREQVQGWRYCPLQRQRRKMEQNDK